MAQTKYTPDEAMIFAGSFADKFADAFFKQLAESALDDVRNAIAEAAENLILDYRGEPEVNPLPRDLVDDMKSVSLSVAKSTLSYILSK